MHDPHADILAQVLEWSPQERGDLAAKLIESLDPVPDDEVSASLVNEIRRRAQEIDSGSVTLQSWEEVRQSLRGEDETLAS